LRFPLSLEAPGWESRLDSTSYLAVIRVFSWKARGTRVAKTLSLTLQDSDWLLRLTVSLCDPSEDVCGGSKESISWEATPGKQAWVSTSKSSEVRDAYGKALSKEYNNHGDARA